MGGTGMVSHIPAPPGSRFNISNAVSNAAAAAFNCLGDFCSNSYRRPNRPLSQRINKMSCGGGGGWLQDSLLTQVTQPRIRKDVSGSFKAY